MHVVVFSFFLRLFFVYLFVAFQVWMWKVLVSPTHLAQSLHWLPMRARIQHRVSTLCFNVITGTGPQYLSKLLYRCILPLEIFALPQIQGFSKFLVLIPKHQGRGQKKMPVPLCGIYIMIFLTVFAVPNSDIIQTGPKNTSLPEKLLCPHAVPLANLCEYNNYCFLGVSAESILVSHCDVYFRRWFSFACIMGSKHGA